MTVRNQVQPSSNQGFEGILPINKPKGITAFQLVRILRRHLGIQKIGHAGTLDPFATGVMVMLIGRQFTRLSDQLLNEDKEYLGRIHLGITTDTYDCEGAVLQRSEMIPSDAEVFNAVNAFQGEILQEPPMYSAKKVNGKKLYELARKGLVIERKSVPVKISLEIIAYNYPYVDIRVACSKGTYIRSLAHDFGNLLGCGGHLSSLQRTRSGIFTLADCVDGEHLQSDSFQKDALIDKYFDLSRVILSKGGVV